MTERLDEKLIIALEVLSKLHEGPIRWTPLLKSILEGETTPWKARVILDWLLKEVYIERPERGIYRITVKGLQFLKLQTKR